MAVDCRPIRVWVGIPGAILCSCIVLAGCSLFTGTSGEPAGDISQPKGSVASEPGALSPKPDPIVDLGVREGAHGESIGDPDVGWRYQVVAGDNTGSVCERFARAWWQMETVDRQAGFDCFSMIYPGEILVPTDATLEEIQSNNGLPLQR